MSDRMQFGMFAGPAGEVSPPGIWCPVLQRRETELNAAKRLVELIENRGSVNPLSVNAL